jgi:ABC-type branched-subunit amino acid transport system permease subunit
MPHVTFIVVGGVGSLAGSVVGAIALTLLPEALRGFKEYNEFIYGGLLLLVLIAFPKGLVGLWNTLWQRVSVTKKPRLTLPDRVAP